MIWTEEHVNKLLAVNPSIAIPPNSSVDFVEASKKWEGQKVVLARKIAKDMNACQESNGNDFAVDLWNIVMREIAVTSWNRACGVFAIWKAIYKKASAKVQQDRPQEVSTLINQILNNSLVKENGYGE